MKKHHILYILSVITISIIFSVWLYINSESTPVDNSQYTEIKVYISGGVNRPGVYTMMQGDRLEDLLKSCGGTTDNAITEDLNLAEFLRDGEHIIINEKVIETTETATASEPSATTAMSASQSASASSSQLININTADTQTLTQLSGIGELRAQAIIDYRNLHGSFQSTDELMNISGISTKIYENIKDKITVE